ncbi:hypothetical protein PVAP13_8KG331804 [Panicum virgatum]|uniref:Uncharacterized protein n=1 Tax=Panicum virgatum TaxID=38727 RepID=A0A8T0PM48_PANVG|nr:hypothetical protein PVAP13_8KG331804 [Panicum virgatum]
MMKMRSTRAERVERVEWRKRVERRRRVDRRRRRMRLERRVSVERRRIHVVYPPSVPTRPDDRVLIIPTGDSSWQDTGFDGRGHHRQVNAVLGNLCHLHNPGVVTNKHETLPCGSCRRLCKEGLQGCILKCKAPGYKSVHEAGERASSTQFSAVFRYLIVHRGVPTGPTPVVGGPSRCISGPL